MCSLHSTLVDTSVTWPDGTHSLGADLTQARVLREQALGRQGRCHSWANASSPRTVVARAQLEVGWSRSHCWHVHLGLMKAMGLG